ncbi:MAG: hypothetical protein HY526_13405 [Betaproteobacteria bacterium]|nr:hypothetical protein [Betaproteobacteria bacterium]
MTVTDLKTLRAPLLVLAMTVVAAAAAVFYTDNLLEQSRRDLARHEAQLREARTRLYRSGEEKEAISRYLGAYRQLQHAGFIGEEQRINWLDGLRLANERTELFGVDYQINAQRPYPYAAALDAGPIALNQSVMKLRFRLLHEEDLMRFFTALAATGAGVFLVDECTLKRIDTGAVSRVQPNLLAECDLSWITAKPAVVERKP